MNIELAQMKIGKVVRSRTHRTLSSLNTEAFYNMADLRVEPFWMIGGRNSKFWDKKVHIYPSRVWPSKMTRPDQRREIEDNN